MNEYKDLQLDKAYRMLNHGPVVMLSTRSESGFFDIAPIAWNCPIKKNPPKLLFAVGKSHRTYKNIKETGVFAVCVPDASWADFVRFCGSVSGDEEDKFEKLGRDTFSGEKTSCLIPSGLSGYIECSLSGEVEISSVSLITGDALKAGFCREAFSDRLRPENEKGRTLHHLGGGEFAVLSGEVNSKK